MGNRKLYSMILLLLLGISALYITKLVGAIEPLPPSEEYVAQYRTIKVDGNLSDWAGIQNVTVKLYDFNDSSNIVEIQILFSYNDTTLFGAIVAPDTNGSVKAIDLAFIGRMNSSDEMYIDYHNTTFDLKQVPGQPPIDDTADGGVDNLKGVAIVQSNGTIFEFEKALDSGDTVGGDFSLYYGASIGILTLGWVNNDPDHDGPNYACMANPEEFEYLRLSIGEDKGEILNIYPPPAFPWKVYPEWNVPKVDVDDLTIDGQQNEDFWNQAFYHDITLNYKPVNKTDTSPNDPVNGFIKIAHDDDNLYIYMELSDDGVEDTFDYTGFFFGDHENFLDDLSIDLAIANTSTYIDGFIEPGDSPNPQLDTSNGGVNDGDAAVFYSSTARQIELVKPLRSDDSNGYDINVEPYDTVFISIFASYNSEFKPNYIDMDVEPDGFFSYIVHPIHLVGENPQDEFPKWQISSERYYATYIDPGSQTIAIDGHDDESFWADAPSVHVTVYKINEFDTVDKSNFFDGEVKFATDGINLYIFFSIYDDIPDSSDFTIFAFANSDQIFDDSYGVDLVFINTTSCTDSYISQETDGPTPDILNGGINDGQAAVRYDNDQRIIEFMKPIANDDVKGSDINKKLGEDLYFNILLRYGSAATANTGDDEDEDEPNYGQVVDLNGEVALDIHPLHLNTEADNSNNTQQSSENTNLNNSSNSITLGFGPVDFVIIGSGLTLVMALIQIRRRKMH